MISSSRKSGNVLAARLERLVFFFFFFSFCEAGKQSIVLKMSKAVIRLCLNLSGPVQTSRSRGLGIERKNGRSFIFSTMNIHPLRNWCKIRIRNDQLSPRLQISNITEGVRAPVFLR
jgi:hypothetical protein